LSTIYLGQPVIDVQQRESSPPQELSALRESHQEAETATGQRNFNVDDLLILYSCFESKNYL